MARGLGINKRGFANSSVTRSVTSSIAGVELSDPVSIYLPFDSDVNCAAHPGHSGTASGSAAISSTQAKFGGNSLSLNGTSQYVSYANDADFQFGDGDFTIEAWIYSTAAAGAEPPSQRHAIVGRMDSTSNRSWNVDIRGVDSKQKLAFGWTTNGSSAKEFIYDCDATINNWHHIAICRSGPTVYGFLNGVSLSYTSAGSAGSDIGSENIYAGTSDLTVGVRVFAGQYFQGYIDDLRILKGVARYTKSFIPPSQAVGAKLIGSNETNTTTDFTALYLPFTADLDDDSSHSHTLTAVGSVAISSTQSKYGSNSAAFDGNGDGLTIPNSTAFNFGSGDFTVEAWVYLNNTSQVHHIASWRSDSGAGSTNWHLDVPGSNITFHASNGSSYIVDSSSMSMAAKTGWQHVAVTRSGDTFMMFSDGQLMATTTASGTVASTSRNFNIGLDPASDSNCLNGYINDLRILAGYAKYTADFDPPTSTVGTSVSETVNDLTVLYLPFDDDSMEDQARNHAITKNGSTSSRINTSVKKFGTSSARFEDADREIHIPGGKFNLGSSFTIEGWYYLTEYTEHSVGFTYDEIGGSSGKDSLVLGLATSDGKVRFQIGLNGGSEYIMVGHDVTNTKLSLNTWTHVACVRDGTNLYLFKDGVQQGATMTVTSSSLVLSETTTDHVFVIGGSTHSPSPYSNHGMAGYIDDFRIVDGVALYTSNFTPPTSAVGLAVESGGVTTNTVENKFLSSVWSLKDQNKKISRGEWIRNDVADTGANAKGRVIKGAGLEDTNHRWYEAPPTVQIAWGSTYQGTDVQLSNSDLTAQIYQEGTSSWGQNAVVSVGTHSSGKVYFEAVVSGNPTSGYMRIGVVQNKGSAFNSTIQGGSMGSWGSDTPAYANKSENKSQLNGSDIDDGSDGFSNGDVIMWAFDIDSGLVYFGKNGTFDDRGLNGHSSFDPVNETGGFDMTSLSGYSSSHPWHILFQNLQFGQTPEHKVTLRLSSEEQYMPSGYSYWGTYVG